MARYTGPKFKLCRREGLNLFGNKKFDIEKRDYPPGQHGNRRVKLSDFGLQLREKQKVKRIYGILEKQFRRYYEKAASAKGVTGHILLQFLERRLDNTIYRLGFATTRMQARQIVSHGFVYVNDRRVDIASYLVKQDDEVILKVKEDKKKFIKDIIDQNEKAGRNELPSWLNVDTEHLRGKVVKLPEREDVNLPINEQLIVELYSK